MIKKQEEILRDIKKNGKEFDWRGWKLKNSQLAYIFGELGKFKKSENISCCGSFLKFVKANNENWQGFKLIEARFCKHKLCPLCNKRRTDKHVYQVKIILNVAKGEKSKARYLFLTLTDKNAFDGKSLDMAIKSMTKAFDRLFKRTKVKKNFIGAMRVTEITVNEKDGSYNQHMHVLLMVEPSYFNSQGNYINQEEWTQMWRESLQVEYTPIVHITSVKPHKTKAKNEMDISGAVYEVAKYPIKDSDYLTYDEEENKRRVNDLDIGLFRKRQISYLGLFKDIKKRLRFEELESKTVDLISENDMKNTDKLSDYIIFKWDKHRKNYYKY